MNSLKMKSANDKNSRSDTSLIYMSLFPKDFAAVSILFARNVVRVVGKELKSTESSKLLNRGC